MRVRRGITPADVVLWRLVASAPRRRFGGWFEVAPADRARAEELAKQKLVWFDVLIDGEMWARVTLRGRWRLSFSR